MVNRTHASHLDQEKLLFPSVQLASSDCLSVQWKKIACDLWENPTKQCILSKIMLFYQTWTGSIGASNIKKCIFAT